MPTETDNLINLTVQSDTKLSELLMRASLIARKYKDQDFRNWIQQELHGYRGDDSVPEYRKVSGTPVVENPYHGWQPIQFKDSESRKSISSFFWHESVVRLESEVRNQVTYIPYHESEQDRLSKRTGVAFIHALCISSSSIDQVLGLIRDKLLARLSDMVTDTEDSSSATSDSIIFPQVLISRLPSDVKSLADDFNFNFSHERSCTCMLILRRMLPLAIVRKFQRDDNEDEVRNPQKDSYLQTKKLLEKAKSLVKEQRVYKELANYKSLLDASQHSYTLNAEISDAQGTGIALRTFLEELFPD